MAEVKTNYVNKMLARTKDLANVKTALHEIYNTYFDRGYNSGGSDPIQDSDIVSANVTATDVANMITLIENLDKFFDNQSVTTGDYDATLNQFRRDI